MIVQFTHLIFRAHVFDAEHILINDSIEPGNELSNSLHVPSSCIYPISDQTGRIKFQ